MRFGRDGAIFQADTKQAAPTLPAQDPHLGCLLNTPLWEKIYSQLLPASAAPLPPSLRKDQSCARTAQKFRNPEHKTVGERQVEPKAGVTQEVGRPGRCRWNLASRWALGWLAQELGRERSPLDLGGERHISPWVPGSPWPAPPHTAPPSPSIAPSLADKACYLYGHDAL